MQSFLFRNCILGLLYVAEMCGTIQLVFTGHLILRMQQMLGRIGHRFWEDAHAGYPHAGWKILQTVIS